MPSRSGFPFAKTVTVLASIFGIALGLCGMNLVLLRFGIGRGGPESYFGGPVLSTLGLIELAAMAISGPLLVVTVIVWVISGALGTGRGSDPQRLFDNSDSDSAKDDDRSHL